MIPFPRPVHVVLLYRPALAPRELVEAAVRLRDLGRWEAAVSESQAWILLPDLRVEATVYAVSVAAAVGLVEVAVIRAVDPLAVGVGLVERCRPVV